MSPDIVVPYRLEVSVDAGRVILRGVSERGDSWMVAMLPAPTAHLILKLSEAVRMAESGEVTT